jgi:glycosyltransferase involved in cell wall biosynthesis
MELDDLTVIVSNYNTPIALLERAISAIKSYNLKYLIVDDGSSDEHRKLLAQFGDNVLYLPENQGQAKARLAGFKAATTKWVMNHDSDDYLISTPVICEYAEINLSPTVKPELLNIEQLFAIPYAYLNGAIMTKCAALLIYEGVETRLNDDIEAMSNAIGYKVTRITHKKPWYYYDSGREGSITKTHSFKEKVAAREGMKKRHMEKFNVRF